MSYNITFTDENGIITINSNMVDDAEYIESIKDRCKNAEFTKKCRYTLSDFTNVTALKISSDRTRKSTKLSIEAAKQNKFILVVADLPTDIEYGMGRMWQSYAEETGWLSFPA